MFIAKVVTTRHDYQTGPLKVRDQVRRQLSSYAIKTLWGLYGIMAPIKDAFCARKPPLCQEMARKGGISFGCLELCLYGIRELT